MQSNASDSVYQVTDYDSDEISCSGYSFSGSNSMMNGNGRMQGSKLENDNMRDTTGNSFFGNDFEVMPIMNKLYDVLRDVILEGFGGIHLPSLVAVGDQSQGKTSVLEAIVKKQFLPKGDQIQTRCPIEVQLVHIGKEHDSVGYNEILEDDDKTWTFLKDMEQVRKAIQERTDKIKASSPAGVTEKRIVVKIYSPNVPDLTLVDLPGFLNVNIEGQNKDIITKIRDVVRKEICNPNCIILAVTAAGNNIGTSTALKEALRADPHRERTLGIITKLDLMDKGTNCEDVLRGNQYRLQLGFIGVVCRNYEDNSKMKTIDAKMQEERKFLEENYPTIANRNGIPFLTKTISQLLLQRIYHTLPGVRVNIEKLIQAYQARLDAFGTVVEPQERRKMLVGYLHGFRDSFKAQIDGVKRNICTDKLSASAKIQMVFKDLLRASPSEIMNGVTDHDIDVCIKNSHALHTILPMAIDDAFQEFARKEVGKLRQPLIDCAQQVNSIMVGAIRDSCDAEAEKYPKLNNFITLVASDVINDCFKRCKEYLEIFVDSEVALVYSSESEFMQKLRAEDNTKKEIKDSRTNLNGTPENPFEDDLGLFDVTNPIFLQGREEVRKMVKNYFGMVKHNMQEHCPKAISKLLVYEVLNKLEESLTLRLDTAEHADELMKESVLVQRDRAAIQERLEKFINAKEIINEVLRAVAI